MKRASSYLAQASFNVVQMLHSFSARPYGPVSFLARALNKVAAKPIARRLGSNQTIVATAYGRSMTMPAEHPLPSNLKYFPQFNRPLGRALEAIAAQDPCAPVLTVVDVGANIGDTVAILEQYLPSLCSYLCIEPDRDLAALCRSNHIDNSRVRIEQCFIGENEGAPVRLQDNGRANPATKRLTGEPPLNDEEHGRLLRLDTVAIPFADANGLLSLIKVDTEGYDFSVLRSGKNLLTTYYPSLFFEWFPRLLRELKEDEWAGFDYLAGLGYYHFVFFTELGDFYCTISHPSRLFLRSLAAVVLGSSSVSYFDVFASTSEEICNRLVELSIAEVLPRSQR